MIRSRHAREIREGGVSVFLGKTRAAAAIGLAVIPVLLVRLLRPLVLIRFGWLAGGRIGHYAADTEFYLCERDTGMQDPRAVDFFYHNSLACNAQLKRMFGRKLRVAPLARWLDRANGIIPGGEKHHISIISRDVHHTRDVSGLLARTQVHLTFTEEEQRTGRQALLNMGIPEGAPFVCFHARDSAYLDAVLPNTDWGYHGHRDSSIQNYLAAAEELVKRGYFAIRMGSRVKHALDSENPRIIDYALNGRTDFMDVFLGANCRFFIGDTAGIFAVPSIFRRPTAFVNYIPLEIAHTWNPYDLFIPKTLWLGSEHRFMSFREILDSGVGRYGRHDQYQRQGIDVVENTPEEIAALAVEMDERLKGTWQTTEEDEELQRSFWSLFKPSELHGEIRSRIGADFLRRNKALLN